MSRRAWILFWAIQGIGAIAGEIWPATMVPSKLISSFGIVCWVIDCYLRLPGNVLSALLIQKYLWMSHLPRLSIVILNLLLTVFFNLLLWLMVAALYRALRQIFLRRKMI